MLCDFTDKAERISALGVDVMVRARFDRAFAEQPPHWFAERVLGELLGAAEVWVGPDFAFGRARKGTVALLEAVGAQRGYVVRCLDPVRVNDERVSSTRVRKAVKSANFAEAAHLLGRPFTLRGTVVHGHQRGRELGFRTANIAPREECLPPDGVYAAWVYRHGERISAALNVGPNPTFELGEELVEAHLLDFDGELYGEQLEVEFVERIRAEIAFRNVQDLARQIGLDVGRIRDILDSVQGGPAQVAP